MSENARARACCGLAFRCISPRFWHGARRSVGRRWYGVRGDLVPLRTFASQWFPSAMAASTRVSARACSSQQEAAARVASGTHVSRATRCKRKVAPRSWLTAVSIWVTRVTRTSALLFAFGLRWFVTARLSRWSLRLVPAPGPCSLRR